MHFCGEHTTQDFQGYLNGAVFTGQRAAGEVLDAYSCFGQIGTALRLTCAYA